MKYLYELRMQILSNANYDEDVEINSIFQFNDHNLKLEYQDIKIGYYDTLDGIRNIIKNKINDINNDAGELVINIYVNVYELNSNQDDVIEIINFHKSGVRRIFPNQGSFVKGDIVIYHPAGNSMSNELTWGIVSAPPVQGVWFDGTYNVLLGQELHDHSHPTEGFITKYEGDECTRHQELNDRLKIGY